MACSYAIAGLPRTLSVGPCGEANIAREESDVPVSVDPGKFGRWLEKEVVTESATQKA